jgi:hypothetical protein
MLGLAVTSTSVPITLWLTSLLCVLCPGAKMPSKWEALNKHLLKE